MFKNLTFIVAAIAIAFNSHGAEISGGGVNLSSPSAIGNATPNTGAFTTLSASSSGTAAAPSLRVGDEQSGLYKDNPSSISVGANGVSVARFYTNGGGTGLYSGYGISSGTHLGLASGGATDVFLLRDAANTLALRNGTTAQTFNVYGTYTNSTNYRLGKASTSTGGVLTISSEGLGTGATGNTISLATNGTERINIGSGGVVSIINTLAVGSGGTAIAKVLSAVATLDYTSIAAGLEQTQTITVTGATTTNTPSVSIGWGSAGLEANLTVTKAWVSAADTVSVTLRNMNTVTAIDPASITCRGTVTQF